jgi:DNA-binding NtrC family response regulator
MTKHSVLIIEDDEFVKNMLRQTFKQAGYEVATASNGRIGIQLYQSEPFDIVITDLIMPDMEGIETITHLRKCNPGVKVIAISGGGRNRPDDYLHLASKLGAAKTFAKPVDRNELLEAVRQLV